MTDYTVYSVVKVAGDAHQPASRTLYRRFGKRSFDLLLCFLILPFVLPFILIVWLAISSDGSNGLFSHKRVGYGGRVFRCWKLRTMVSDAEERLREHLNNDKAAAAEWARDHKLSDDPRITRLGRLLRRTSLDELPQIWNVLVGDMSFVGPRPVVRYELNKYGSHRAVYKSMKPGITGLWQVSGRNEIGYDQRVKLDVHYSHAVSMKLDLLIIAKTVISVLKATGR